jgi:hypothetical protein
MGRIKGFVQNNIRIIAASKSLPRNKKTFQFWQIPERRRLDGTPARNRLWTGTAGAYNRRLEIVHQQIVNLETRE